ncbi:MAG: hypothetical protein QOK05_528 [Chloroflexota bacterium]|jgi:hypothetical protein|nr:hypothetical protein [Chloroflexota bacterium]
MVIGRSRFLVDVTVNVERLADQWLTDRLMGEPDLPATIEQGRRADDLESSLTYAG